MSTRGSTWLEDEQPQEWTVTPKQWCPECCCSGCGCPEAERLLDEAHLIRGTE